jgi:hypothetical protein
MASGGVGGSSEDSGGGGLTSPLTTKGDLWGFTTVNARVPVGTPGQVLSADPLSATGVSWVDPVSASSPWKVVGDIVQLVVETNQIVVGADQQLPSIEAT